MTSFDYRLNPLYRIKECSSCGALYTMDYCCFVGIFEDKIICDLDKTPDLSQRSPQNCPKCGHPVDEPSNDNTNIVNALREPFVVNQDPGKNSSQSPPQINHHCCYSCGNPLEGIFCHQCTCKLCGNGAYYGYNCSLKVSIIPNPEPFNNQTIKELPPIVQSFDPKSDLVHDSLNVFNPPPQLPIYSCEFCGNDARYGHYYTPQVPFVYLEPCYNQDFNFPQKFKIHMIFNNNIFVAGLLMKLTNINQRMKTIIMSKILAMILILLVLINFNPNNIPKEEEKKIEEEQAANARYWKIPACYDDDDDDYTFVITPNEPINSLSMRDEHLDTIPVMKLDEFIKSSVENLVLIPSEYKGENECDVPACEVFTTFSNILFDSDYDFYSSDDQPCSDEDFPKEIYSNPLFDEEIISMKIDQHHFIAESDLIESMLNHDSSIISSSKIDSLFDEFAGELTLLKSIPPGIDETDCDPEEETHFIKRLLYDNSSPHPPEEFVSENYAMPPGIEDDDYDSKRDILILEEFLSNNSLSLPENESFHFDIPSFSRPPAKPPDGNKGEILNVKMMGDVFEQTVPIPRLMITLVQNQEKSLDLLSHLGLKAFQPSAKCPMMIHGKKTPILDVPLFHLYPLDQF
nr:hypothetical protein [Tanacetum cinerariifolium]